MPLHESKLAVSLCSMTLSQTQDTIVELLDCLSMGKEQSSSTRLLDIGCWEGEATMRYAAACGATASGVEVFEEPARIARDRGIDVQRFDLETNQFPWDPGSFDVVVANQVFEHLKNIWLPLSEAYRVLKPDGHLIISVPNLASVHNRLLLALGAQPTSIRTFGPHVRGFTARELVELITRGGAMIAREVRGVGFYPFPAPVGRLLARAWSGGSHTVVLVAQKSKNALPAPWLSFNESVAVSQTYYG